MVLEGALRYWNRGQKMDIRRIEEMIDQAIRQMDFSYVPYSRFRVGAALLAKNGKLYTG